MEPSWIRASCLRFLAQLLDEKGQHHVGPRPLGDGDMAAFGLRVLPGGPLDVDDEAEPLAGAVAEALVTLQIHDVGMARPAL